MNLASRDIRHNLGRFGLTALGIGLLLMMVMGMSGIYRGIIEDATLLVERIGGDLWIVQRDTRGPFAEISQVPPNLVYRAQAVPGVQDAREFVYHTIQRSNGGKPLRMAVLGLSWPEDRGCWLPLIAGRPLNQGHFEMIADRSLQLELGTQVALGRDTYTVVGITRDMISSGGDGIAFFSVDDAQTIQFDRPSEAIRLERAARRSRGETTELGMSQPGLTERASGPAAELSAIGPPSVSAVVIRVLPGASVDAVAANISGWHDVSVYTQEDQRQLLLTGSVEKVRRQIGLFKILLTIIAAIIMALILYTLTLDKLHDIALLKLIGAPNRVILGLILQQALVLGTIGFAVAWALGGKIFPRFPRRVILIEEDLVQLALIVVVISIGSSLLGIYKAMKISPNEALSG